MSSKRQDMRKKAKNELARQGKIKPSIEKEAEQPPSFFRGFLLIFLGTFATIFFISLDQFLLGIIVGAPFILIGSFRINKASMINSRSKTRN